MLRQKQREQRRQRILNAAEALIRETGGTDFSMLSLAQAAEVSPVTPYKLFESKGGIMFALLNRSMDQVVSGATLGAGPTEEPIGRVLDAAQAAAGVFARDPQFYRPLYRFLLGVPDPAYRPQFLDRGLDYWKRSLEAARERGWLEGAIERDELARELEIHFIGVLDLWVQHELNEDEFLAQVQYGTSLLLFGIAEAPGARERLFASLREAQGRLPKAYSFSAQIAAQRNRALEGSHLASGKPTIKS